MVQVFIVPPIKILKLPLFSRKHCYQRQIRHTKKYAYLINIVKYCLLIVLNIAFVDFCRGVDQQNMMDSSPGLVRRRIQEMTTSFQTQHSPRSSPKNSPKNQIRKKMQSSLQPSLANVDSNKMPSVSLSNNKFRAGAMPFKKLYTATATATITTTKSPTMNRRNNNLLSSNGIKDVRKAGSFQKQKLNTELKNRRVFTSPDYEIDSDYLGEKMKTNSNENTKRFNFNITTT